MHFMTAKQRSFLTLSTSPGKVSSTAQNGIFFGSSIQEQSLFPLPSYTHVFEAAGEAEVVAVKLESIPMALINLK